MLNITAINPAMPTAAPQPATQDEADMMAFCEKLATDPDVCKRFARRHFHYADPIETLAFVISIIARTYRWDKEFSVAPDFAEKLLRAEFIPIIREEAETRAQDARSDEFIQRTNATRTP